MLAYSVFPPATRTCCSPCLTKLLHLPRLALTVLTYSVIPTQHRLLWVDSVELVWVTYLSFYGQQQRGKMAEEAAAAGGDGPIITQVGWETAVPVPAFVAGKIPEYTSKYE